jgi:hypothetical protein
VLDGGQGSLPAVFIVKSSRPTSSGADAADGITCQGTRPMNIAMETQHGAQKIREDVIVLIPAKVDRCSGTSLSHPTNPLEIIESFRDLNKSQTSRTIMRNCFVKTKAGIGSPA